MKTYYYCHEDFLYLDVNRLRFRGSQNPNSKYEEDWNAEKSLETHHLLKEIQVLGFSCFLQYISCSCSLFDRIFLQYLLGKLNPLLCYMPNGITKYQGST